MRSTGVLPPSEPCGRLQFVVKLPFLNPLLDCILCWILSCPEFIQIRELRTLDFAIEVGRAWRDRSELDALAHEPSVYGLCEELTASISLNALNRKRHFADDTVKKKQRILGVSPRIDSQYTQT